MVKWKVANAFLPPISSPVSVSGHYHGCSRTKYAVPMLNSSNGSDINKHLDAENKQYSYKPPKHSESFLEHLKEVKKAWPSEITSNEPGEDEAKNDDASDPSDYGVFCTGEPSIDPSRQIRSIIDGESDWI